MSDLYDKLYEDLKACALAAIPVDPMDGTTFLQFEGRTCIWGSPDVVAAAVASATYTVVGIRLDDARAEGVAAGRKQAAADLDAEAARMRREDFRPGLVSIEYINGWEAAAHIVEGGGR